MPYGLAVDNWSSTVGTAHTAGDGQLVLAALNGLPTLPPGRIYRLTAATNPDTPAEVILGVFQATGIAGLALTGFGPAAGYTDVNLAAGVVVQIRVCKATIDELQAGIEAHVPNGAAGDVQINNGSGAFAGGGPSWNGQSFLALNGNISSYVFFGFGRTAVEIAMGVAAANGQFFANALAGDTIIKAGPGGYRMLIGTGDPTYALVIDTSNNVTFVGSIRVAGQICAGSGITSSRPAAFAVGAQWYDTTLHKPIWWDGTAWRDASGTAV